MAVVKVQSITGAGPTLVLSSVASGNLLTLEQSAFDGASAAALATPTDSNGTFAVASADAGSLSGVAGAGLVGIWYLKNAAAGTHTVTPTARGGFNCTLTEWSGLDTVSPSDKATSASSAAGAQTSQVTGTTAATTQADELVLIALSVGASPGAANMGITDPVSGFTTLQVVQDDAANIGTLHGYKIVAATGAQSATFNWTDASANESSMGCIATFKALAGDVGPNRNIVIRGGRGVNLGPAGRRMAPQRFPDTIPFAQDGSSVQGPFRRGMGPRMRFRLAQRFPDNSINAYSLSVVSGAYILTGVAAPLQHNDDLVATTGTYVVTGNAATLEHGYLISPAKGAYVLTGIAVTFQRGYVLSAVTGAYSLTGRVLNLIVGRLVSAASGAYVLAGISDSFLRGYTVAPSSGPYTLVGNTATLTYSGATASPSPTQNSLLASAPKLMNRR